MQSPLTANLRAFKEARELTWPEVARACAVGERLVNTWASDEGTDPSWPNVCRLARLFGVHPCVLYMPPDLAETIAREGVDHVNVDSLVWYSSEAAA